MFNRLDEIVGMKFIQIVSNFRKKFFIVRIIQQTISLLLQQHTIFLLIWPKTQHYLPRKQRKETFFFSYTFKLDYQMNKSSFLLFFSLLFYRCASLINHSMIDEKRYRQCIVLPPRNTCLSRYTCAYVYIKEFLYFFPLVQVESQQF